MLIQSQRSATKVGSALQSIVILSSPHPLQLQELLNVALL